jgi:hypothetical protein
MAATNFKERGRHSHKLALPSLMCLGYYREMGRWFWGQILGKRAFKRLYSEDLFGGFIFGFRSGGFIMQ